MFAETVSAENQAQVTKGEPTGQARRISERKSGALGDENLFDRWGASRAGFQFRVRGITLQSHRPAMDNPPGSRYSVRLLEELSS